LDDDENLDWNPIREPLGASSLKEGAVGVEFGEKPSQERPSHVTSRNIGKEGTVTHR
jgi:hypothetical protein